MRALGVALAVGKAQAQALPVPSLGPARHFEDPFSENEPNPGNQPAKNC